MYCVRSAAIVKSMALPSSKKACLLHLAQLQQALEGIQQVLVDATGENGVCIEQPRVQVPSGSRNLSITAECIFQILEERRVLEQQIAEAASDSQPPNLQRVPNFCLAGRELTFSQYQVAERFRI